ncbi:MAG: DUF4097 family beta strand repeat-containing protein [Candidatus Aminicenantales bacterium]
MKRILPAVVAALTAAASACVIPVYMDEGSRWNKPGEAFRQTIPFKAGGVLRIDNAYGNVVIRGWDNDTIEITAEETWDESAGAADRTFQRSEVVPQVEIETRDETVTITARPRDAALAGDRIVHLFVRVPHHVDLRSVTGRRGRLSLSDLYGEALLRLDDGDVRIENYSGNLDVELGRGEIQAEMIDLRSGDSDRFVLNAGPVTISLDPAFIGRLEAAAPAGTLECDFKVDPPAEPTRASGTIGTGEGALIFVSARKGDVRIRKTS